MRLIDYLKDRHLFIGINIILFLLIAILMGIVRIGFGIILLVFVIWFSPIVVYIIIEYIKFKNYLNELINLNEQLDRKYLISEVIIEPNFIEGKIINNILKDTNRDMQENVKYYKNMQKEYQEYVETWVHEIKTPIASTMLIIENNEDIIPNNMKYELRKVEDYVEQALYYSRSNEVSQDYIVKRFNLEQTVRKVIKRNASDFINKKIAIDIENIKGEIHSDPKWVEFIINQIIGNSIKYLTTQNPKVTIYTTENENNTILIIKDNGVGINEKDLKKVFEKGFTGANGRIYAKSTGIGLYLCQKLCKKLGLRIKLTSKENEGTEVKIIFPLIKITK
ncbi:sensor histidine kinase [Romboutsia sedimentorum]|uniref:sensor histidine kinase n=1 Tax=Romboutsia sedimentorum TaxID=1368474 RepID=UPI0024DE5550|nr:sensor histidine kinase [Romboutsia sedimentorum]MDK2587059.1 sensor histidine kinase [Romboutsia sedimentorum]